MLSEGKTLNESIDHMSELHFAEAVDQDQEANAFSQILEKYDTERSTMDAAADVFDNMIDCLGALGDFGWRLTKDVSTNTWQITEPIVKPAAKEITKKLMEQGLAGWNVVQDKATKQWKIIEPHATSTW